MIDMVASVEPRVRLFVCPHAGGFPKAKAPALFQAKARKSSVRIPVQRYPNLQDATGLRHIVGSLA